MRRAMSCVYCEPKSRTRTVCSPVVTLQEVPQLLPRFEADGVARRDLHFLAGFRIAADALLALLDLEGGEAAQLDALPAGQGVAEAFDHRVHRLRRLDARNLRHLGHLVDDIGFNHAAI